MNDQEITSRLRRRLMIGGAGFLAGAGMSALARSAAAQAKVELPMANGRRNLVAYPELACIPT